MSFSPLKPGPLRDLQASRLPPDDAQNEPIAPPEPPTPAAEIQVETTVQAPEADEPNLAPEQARFAYMQSEVQRFDAYQFPQTQPD